MKQTHHRKLSRYEVFQIGERGHITVKIGGRKHKVTSANVVYIDDSAHIAWETEVKVMRKKRAREVIE